MGTEVHPTAVIHPKAQLGKEVSIGPYAIIEANVILGDYCQIDAFAHIKSMTTMGKRNEIHSYACVGGPPQDMKYQNEPTILEIGDDNCIREYVTINRGTNKGGGITRLGSKCLIMAYAHIAHDCQIGNQVILANAATLAGHVIVENMAVIGGLSAVHQFVRIGEHAYIGGMTGVSQDVPPFMLIAGERGWLQGINTIGLKRRGFEQKQLSKLKKAFKTIWRSGLQRKEALQRVINEFGHEPTIMQLVNFMSSSERGVIGTKNLKSNNNQTSFE